MPTAPMPRFISQALADNLYVSESTLDYGALRIPQLSRSAAEFRTLATLEAAA